MKIFISLAFSCLLPLFVFGQAKQSIDFIGGLDYSSRRLTADADNTFCDDFYEEISDSDRLITNWRFGINYNRKVARKIWFRTGLRLASVGYQTKQFTLTLLPGDAGWGDVLDGLNYGNTYARCPTPLISTFSSRLNLLFLEVPLVVRYETSHNKLTPFVELGLSPSFYLRTRETDETADGMETISYTDDRDGFNSLHFVGTMAFGLNYSLSDSWQLFGQPTLRYHFTSIYDNSSRDNLYNFGLEMGVRRRL